jgi:hypothetical protein
MDKQTYCAELTKLYVELSKPLEPRFAYRYDEYTVPMTNQIRVQNYLEVMKQLYKNCPNNNEKNKQIFDDISTNTKSYYNNIKMILDQHDVN